MPEGPEVNEIMHSLGSEFERAAIRVAPGGYKPLNGTTLPYLGCEDFFGEPGPGVAARDADTTAGRQVLVAASCHAKVSRGGGGRGHAPVRTVVGFVRVWLQLAVLRTSAHCRL